MGLRAGYMSSNVEIAGNAVVLRAGCTNSTVDTDGRAMLLSMRGTAN